MPELHTEAFRYHLPLIVLPAAVPAHMAPVPPQLRTHPHPAVLPLPDRRYPGSCCHESPFVHLSDPGSHPHAKDAGSGFQIRPGFSQPDVWGESPAQISFPDSPLPGFRPPSPPSLRSCLLPLTAAAPALLHGQTPRLSSEDAQSPSEASDPSPPAVLPPVSSPPASPYRWKDPARTPQMPRLLPH